MAKDLYDSSIPFSDFTNMYMDNPFDALKSFAIN